MSSYERELVEKLTPTIFDRHYAWGMVDELRPDPQMPKSKAQKNQGNTLWAHLADIRSAWAGAALTFKERRAVVMHYGLGWDHRHVAEHEGTSRQAVTERLAVAIGKLCDFLNGTDNYADELDDGPG